MIPTQLIEKIEKEFDEKFPAHLPHTKKCNHNGTPAICHVKSYLFSTNIQTLEMLKGMCEGMKESPENRCAKCNAIFYRMWLPPICPKCFYLNDKDEWNGVQTKETSDQRTSGFNFALSSVIFHIDNIISELKKKI